MTASPPFISLASCIISARSLVCSTSPDPWHAFLHIYLCMYIPVLQHIGRHPLGQNSKEIFSSMFNMEMVQIFLNVFQSSFFLQRCIPQIGANYYEAAPFSTQLSDVSRNVVLILDSFCKFCKEFRLAWVMLLL